MANRRFIDFPIAASVGNNDIVLIWQDGMNKQTTKATLLQGSPQSLAGLTDVDISALNNGQILQYNSTTSKWENVDRTDINLSELGDVTIVAPANGQVLVYNSSTGKWENSSGGYVPYTGAVTTVNLGAQTIQAGSFVKAGGTSAQFLKANGSVDSTAYGTGTVTSVALTMPSAFSVGGSPITTAGTLAVTGAGTVGQYIRGDGSLADFPATTGGGSSVSYYLNGSVSQGTIGGVAYREVNRTPIFGAGTDISINANGYIASFITDALDPNKLLIPAGNWNFETYFSANSGGGSPSFYIELYKYNGTTFTLIATSSATPELIAFGTNINPYFSTLAVPETVLALTDRLALRYYVTHSGRTITLHTENGHLCQIITTFTTGLTALNGLTNQVQFFAVGTNGTDFAISSASDTHTFNLPTASATNRGALSSADWTTFNNKQNALTLTTTGTSGAATLVGSTLNIPQYQAAGTYVTAVTASSPLASSGGTTPNITIQQASGSQSGFLSSTDWTTFNNKQNALTNPVTGTGTSGTLPKFTGSTTIGNSLFSDNGTNGAFGGANYSSGTDVRTFNISSPLYSGLGFWANNVYTGDIFSYGFTGNLLINADPTNVFANTRIALSIDGTERLGIFSNGNVSIANSPTDAGFKLDVNGTGRFSGNLSLNTSSLILGLGNGGSNEAVYFNYNSNAASRSWRIIKDWTVFGDFQIQQSTTQSGTTYADILRFLPTGAATFSSSVSAKVNNISADGAGVVLQGYVDNILRIAVRGSGYNDGARGGLLASTGDFSGNVTSLGNFGSNAANTSTAPQYFLTQAGGNTYSAIGINRADGTGIAAGIGSALVLRSGDATNFPIQFATANNVRMTITSSGNLLVGTTSEPGERITLNGRIGIVGATVASGNTRSFFVRGSQNVADGGTLSINVANTALIFIAENNTGTGALFFCGYASGTITKISDPSNMFDVADTAGKLCIFKSSVSDVATVKNRLGSTRNITVSYIGVSD